MAGGRVPGPLDGKKAEPIDRGTLNRQASNPPGPVGVLRHRYKKPWESTSNRRLVEFNSDPRAQRSRAVPYTEFEYRNAFEGFRAPKLSPIRLVPNPDFQATPWENDFDLAFLNGHPKSHPILNASNEVVGHVAYFTYDHIFYPKKLGPLALSDVVDSGLPAFVRKETPDTRFWRQGPVMRGYELVVTPDGEVMAVLSNHDIDGLKSYSTWEYLLAVLTIVDGAMLLRRLVGQKAALAAIDKQIFERAAAAEQRRFALARTQPDPLAATRPAGDAAAAEQRKFALARTQPDGL